MTVGVPIEADSGTDPKTLAESIIEALTEADDDDIVLQAASAKGAYNVLRALDLAARRLDADEELATSVTVAPDEGLFGPRNMVSFRVFIIDAED